MNKIIVTIIIFLATITFKVSGQELKTMEDSLSTLFSKINEQNTTVKIDSCNQLFLKYLTESLQISSSFKYPYSSLSKVGKITSDDKKIRCYSWNTVTPTGNYRYFSIIQVKNSDNSTSTFQLIDNKNTAPIPEDCELSASEWYGALYYKIIKFGPENLNQYILLGWDGNNYKSTKKIIDVLKINADHTVILGAPVFYEDKIVKYRKVFEYSSKAKMTLNYDKKKKRIIFDHLIPIQSGYEGMYEFYGPDVSYDAFILNGNKWILKNNVQRRDRKNPNYYTQI